MGTGEGGRGKGKAASRFPIEVLMAYNGEKGGRTDSRSILFFPEAGPSSPSASVRRFHAHGSRLTPPLSPWRSSITFNHDTHSHSGDGAHGQRYRARAGAGAGERSSWAWTRQRSGPPRLAVPRSHSRYGPGHASPREHVLRHASRSQAPKAIATEDYAQFPRHETRNCSPSRRARAQPDQVTPGASSSEEQEGQPAKAKAAAAAERQGFLLLVFTNFWTTTTTV